MEGTRWHCDSKAGTCVAKEVKPSSQPLFVALASHPSHSCGPEGSMGGMRPPVSGPSARQPYLWKQRSRHCTFLPRCPLSSLCYYLSKNPRTRQHPGNKVASKQGPGLGCGHPSIFPLAALGLVLHPRTQVIPLLSKQAPASPALHRDSRKPGAILAIPCACCPLSQNSCFAPKCRPSLMNLSPRCTQAGPAPVTHSSWRAGQ